MDRAVAKKRYRNGLVQQCEDLKEIFPLSLCVCLCVHVHMHCVLAHVEARGLTSVAQQVQFTLFLETGLSLAWNSPNK